MNALKLHLVVMAGGSGTRFWPKSTSRRPKQLLSFGNSQDGTKAKSLLEQTLSRFDGIVPHNQRMIVTTQLIQDEVRVQAHGAEVLAEPQGRNTAPCVYWAARAIAERDSKAVMMVMPADHYVAQPESFRKTLLAAAQWATEHDDLVTLGIRPTRPETGYGYLKMGKSLAEGCNQVAAFVEKPNTERAQEFLRSGGYLWNGGMFLWRAEVILKAFDRYMPEMKKSWDDTKGDVTQAYPKMTATSIDYGIMEKSDSVVTFPLDCGWDDLGSWTSLETMADVLSANKEGNVLSSGDLVSIQSSGNIVDAAGKLVALLGVKDLIIVESGQSLLIAKKDQAQDIKLIVEQVKKQRPELA